MATNSSNSSSSNCTSSLPEASVPEGFCAYALPVAVDQARTVLATGTSDFVFLERGTQSVFFCFDTNGDGLADAKILMASANGLNHGLAIHDNFLYASSDSTVYRWPLVVANSSDNSSSRTNDFRASAGTTEPQIVVNNINRDGQGGAPFGHTTRTLIFDQRGRLYVAVGSASNIDSDSFRARIRRFDLASNATALPIDFLTGEVFADGLRNEVGLAFDRFATLWGVENSADELQRQDLGGDIHQNNPAEELNRFREEDIGKNWGYPWCWTEFALSLEFGHGQGAVWAWPSFLDSGKISDQECRANYIPPAMALQGHSAPLGIVFYHWKHPSELPASCPPGSAFPSEMDGYAFIAYHGSWNRDIPTGYKVVFVPMDENGNPVGNTPYDLLKHEPSDTLWPDGFRPVDVDFDACGRLLVSSDGSRSNGYYAGSKIVRIEYLGGGDDGNFTLPELLPVSSGGAAYASFLSLLPALAVALVLVVAFTGSMAVRMY